MRYRHYIVLIVALIVAACSGGGGSGTAGKTPAASSEQKPAATSEIGEAGNSGTIGVTIIETPASETSSGTKPDGKPASDTPLPPAPDPMVVSITQPVDGGLFALKAFPYVKPIALAGTSNKKEATYKWTVLDPKSATVELQNDSETNLPIFTPKLPGDYIITLSGSAPDGTSNSVSAKISVEKPPSVATFLEITGMTDKSSYPLEAVYPIMALKYSDFSDTKEYFTYQWGLPLRPEGSKAEIASTSHSAAFQADVEGSYTIQVTATNVVGATTVRSITVKMLPIRIIPLLGYFGGKMIPNMILSSGDQEIYLGTDYGVLKYGKTKLWLPIISDSSNATPVMSAARVSETEVYFGSRGKILQYDGANYSVIKLPDSHKNYEVREIAATTGDVWAVATITGSADLLHITNGKAEVVTVGGEVLHAEKVIMFDASNIIAFGAAYEPVMHYQGTMPGWKTIPAKYTQGENGGEHWTDMKKCARGGATDPVTCISSKNTVYTISPGNGSFGPLTKSQELNPLPQGTPLDIAWDTKAGLAVLNNMGEVYAYNPDLKAWGKDNSLQGLPPDSEGGTGIVGTIQFNLPKLIAATGVVYRKTSSNADNLISWIKETMFEFGEVRDMIKLPDGQIVLAGKAGGKAAVAVMDVATKQIVSYYKSDVDSLLYNLSGIGLKNLYGSVNGGLVHFDGTSFKKLTPSDNLILFNDSGSTAIAMHPDGSKLYAAPVYITNPTLMMSLDGQEYTVMKTDIAPLDIRDFIVIDANNIFAFGKGYKEEKNIKFFAVWKLAGDVWKIIYSHEGKPAFEFRDAYAASPNDISVVGANGKIIHFDGTGWKEEISNITDAIISVSGADGQVWAMTESGQLLKRDAAVASWPVVNDLPKSQACNLWTLMFIDPNNYLYAGPCDFSLVGVMSN